MKIVLNDFWIFLKREPLIVLILIFLLSGFHTTLATYATLVLVPYSFVNRKIKAGIDNIYICICCYSFTYALFTFFNGYYSGAMGNVVFQSFYPPLFYLLGKRLFQVSPNSIYMLFVMVIGLMALPVVLDVVSDIRENQFINMKRQMEDEEGSVSATVLGIYVALAVSSIGVLFTKAGYYKDVFYKYVFLILSFLGLMCVTHLLNRTGLVIAIISIMGVMFYNVKYYKSIKPFFIGGFVLLFFVRYFIDWETFSTLTDAYDSRNEGTSVESAGGRTDLWLRGLRDLFIKPFGSHESEKLRYAHNFWLDTARTGGTLSFLFLLNVTIRHLRNSFYVIKSYSPGLLRTLIITCNIGFFLTCLVEPVMEGTMNFVFCFFLFMGIVQSLKNSIGCEFRF